MAQRDGEADGIVIVGDEQFSLTDHTMDMILKRGIDKDQVSEILSNWVAREFNPIHHSTGYFGPVPGRSQLLMVAVSEYERTIRPCISTAPQPATIAEETTVTLMRYAMSLRVRYDEEVDILTVYNGVKIATSSSVDFGLVADYGSEDGHDVVGIELMSAGKLIAPLCAVNSKDFLKSQEVASGIWSLETEYDAEADILKICSTREVEFPFEVGNGLIAFMGYEDSAYRDRYDMVGFELHNASEHLAPWFKLNRAQLSAGADGSV